LALGFLGKEQPVPRTAPPELVYALAKELETLKSLDKFLPRYEGGRATEAINQEQEV
jgi:hypothetical protein